MTRTLCFRVVIRKRGINPFVPVDAVRAGKLKPNWRRPMPVRVQVDGKPTPPWRINLMPAGDGSFLLYLHGEIRKASGTAVGDLVSISLAFDADYSGGPADPMPAWFDAVLRKDAAALQGWTRLPPSRKKEILRYLVRLKSPEARRRNAQRAVFVLGGGKARFMARAWNA